MRGGTTTLARFSAFHGNDLTQLYQARCRRPSRGAERTLDMRHHTRTGVAHTQGISDAFVDWFGIVGRLERARSRFVALAELGLPFLHVAPRLHRGRLPDRAGVARDAREGCRARARVTCPSRET